MTEERQLVIAERERRLWEKRAREAEDAARFLHGICLLYGIDPEAHRLEER